MNAIDKFTRMSGARLAPKDEREDKNTLAVELPATVPAAEASLVTEERSFKQDSFNTKQPIWKNPKVKMAAIAIPSLAATFGVLAIMNGSFQMPSTPRVAAKPEVDDTTPKKATVGDIQGVALSRGLSTGFNKESERKNPFFDSQAQVPANGKKGALGKGQLNQKAVPTIAMNRVASAVPYSSPRPLTRSYAPAPSFGTDSDYTSSRSAYRRSSTAPSSSSSSSSSAGASTVASVPEKSAEERRLAALGVTSSGTDTTQQSSSATASTASAPASSQGQTVASRPSGYQETSYLSSEESLIDGVPQQLINRSKKAQGRLLLGIAFTPGASQFAQGQPVEIAIENPLDTGLPEGAHLIATVDLQQQGGGQTKTAPIRLIPTAITIGDAEYPLPQGAILLTGENGKPLVAKRQGSDFVRFLGSMAKTAVGGIGGGLTSLVGGTNPILAALSSQLSGGLSTGQGAQQVGTEVLALRENTPIQINIIRPLSLPVAQAEPSNDQALFPVPQSSDQLAYREPSDAELISIIDQQQDPQQTTEESASAQ